MARTYANLHGLEKGRRPLHFYYAGEGEAPRSLEKFEPVETTSNPVGVVYRRGHEDGQVREDFIFRRSAESAIQEVNRRSTFGTIRVFGKFFNVSFFKRAAELIRHSPVWDFTHGEKGWTVKPHYTDTYLNGVNMGTAPLFLEPGDVVSSLRNRDGSFKLHARVPIEENENPLQSKNFAALLMQRGAEPRKYGRIIAVLGAMIKEDGSLTDIAEGRVKKAVDEFLNSWEAGVPAALLFSGGLPRYEGNFPEGLTEAEAMRKRAIEMAIKEKPAFKALFEDPLKHLVFVETKSRDAIGNAYFTRRFLEDPKNRAFFGGVQNVDVIIEKQYEHRFGDVFDHIFKGMGSQGSHFNLNYKNPEARRELKADEELKRLETNRQRFLDETTAGNLDSIGRFLVKEHNLYAPGKNDAHYLKYYGREKDKTSPEQLHGLALHYFGLKPNPFQEGIGPWLREVVLPFFTRPFRR